MDPINFFDEILDDKYRKGKTKGNTLLYPSKYQESLDWVMSIVAKKPFLIYGLYVAAVFLTGISLGSDIYGGPTVLFRRASAVMETLGLLTLRQKIQNQKSVTGVSGMTMAMYALVYTLREIIFIPPFSGEKDAIDDWMVEMLFLVSVVVVFEVIWKVFRKYKDTYQKDLDRMNIVYIVPACLVLAAMLHPDLEMGTWNDFTWTACLYLDVFALMPQVFMMQKGSGKVEAPIAHFVAATFFSRCVDLAFWYYSFHLIGVFSAILIVFFHVFHLALVIDFMYYYMKSRLSGSADLVLPTCEGV